MRLSIEDVPIRDGDPGSLTVPEVLDFLRSGDRALTGVVDPAPHRAHHRRRPARPWNPKCRAGIRLSRGRRQTQQAGAGVKFGFPTLAYSRTSAGIRG